MLISFCTYDDVLDLLAVESACFDEPWTERMFADELAAQGVFYLKASDGGRTVGFIGVRTVLDEANVNNIAVMPGYRRAGVGKRLIENAFGTLAEQGVKSVYLEVDTENTAAIGLYAGFGFVPVGKIAEYYPNGNDAYLLKCNMLDGQAKK
ncbi:MAG: ribosomal protein S18-alanine N-acetyltransferase [Firmicutes bacterium]|nr:ribosomal protein S18-alanine N-acetyltransferase [Bacillota bacterium]